MTKPNGPVLFDLENEDLSHGPSDAPPVPDVGAPAPEGRAMQTAAVWASRKRSGLVRLFWGLVVAIIGVVISVSVWDFASGLTSRFPLLGYGFAMLAGAFVVVLLVMCLRELAALSRLRRIDRIRSMAEAARANDDLVQARVTTATLTRLYTARKDTAWGRARMVELGSEQFDAAALLGLAEAELLGPLDAAATREVETAARHVATVTALVPLALADVVAALTANLRMIRRVSEIYGGRAGTIGSWRLARAVMTHLVATGAVAVGDDLIGSITGGGLLSKLSRRFGEGLVNGALTARVGVAAMEICRPLPFVSAKRPSVTGLVRRALTGLFGIGRKGE